MRSDGNDGNKANDDARLRRILADTRTIAMVGASPSSNRDSHSVMAYLKRQGYRVIPVNPTVAENSSILGETVRADLASIPEAFELVDVFRNPQAVAGIVDEILALDRRPRVLWLQLGVIDAQAAERARSAGIGVVMNRCIRIEHRRLRRSGSP